jgi:rRNA processing protein Krr1/Pno1
MITLQPEVEWAPLFAGGVFRSSADVARALLGRRGARIQLIERSVGASISIDSGSNTVTVRGDSRAISLARAALTATLTPAASFDVAAEWAPLIADGVYASPLHIVKAIVGGGSRVKAMCSASGADIQIAPDQSSRVFISGPPRAVSAARAAIQALVVPTATVNVARQWGGLVQAGTHDSLKALMHSLVGHSSVGLEAIERASGARAVWTSTDRGRVFISGDADAVARARAGMDAAVTPAATIDMAALWDAAAAPDGGSGAGAAAGRLSLSEFATRFVGRGGYAISDLEKETGTRIWLSGARTRVQISGEPAAVKAARARVTMQLMEASG